MSKKLFIVFVLAGALFLGACNSAASVPPAVDQSQLLADINALVTEAPAAPEASDALPTSEVYLPAVNGETTPLGGGGYTDDDGNFVEGSPDGGGVDLDLVTDEEAASWEGAKDVPVDTAVLVTYSETPPTSGRFYGMPATGEQVAYPNCIRPGFVYYTVTEGFSEEQDMQALHNFFDPSGMFPAPTVGVCPTN